MAGWHEWNNRRKRDEAIVEAFMQGVTMRQIGIQHGITEARVSQIVDRAGVDRDEGGASLRARLRKNLSAPSCSPL